MEKNDLFTLQEAIEHPGVEAAIFAECDGKRLQVEMIEGDQFALEIDGILSIPHPEKAGEPYLFHAYELDQAIQEHCPSYSKHARIWHDEWTGETRPEQASITIFTLPEK